MVIIISMVVHIDEEKEMTQIVAKDGDAQMVYCRQDLPNPPRIIYHPFHFSRTYSNHKHSEINRSIPIELCLIKCQCSFQFPPRGLSTDRMYNTTKRLRSFTIDMINNLCQEPSFVVNKNWGSIKVWYKYCFSKINNIFRF